MATNVPQDHMDHVQKGERHITQVHMGTLSAAEVRQRSCAEVLDIKASSHDIPVMYSIIDARMGSVERNILCATCKSPGCRTGHPGHIELPMPIYHPLFKDKYICPTLMSVCFFCGGVLIPEFLVQRMSASTQRPDVNETIAEKRFSEYFRYVEQNQNSRRPKCAVHCPRAECGMPQPIYQKCKTSITCYWRLYDVMELHPRLLSLLFTEVEQVQIQQRSEAWKRQIEIELEKDPKYAANLATATRLHGVLRALALPIHMTRFSSYEALRILHSISDDGLRALGFDPKCSRPADMVLTALYVPPVNVRPHSGGVGRARSWNPLSLQYIDVLRLCNEFRHEMEESKIPFNNEICPFPNRVVPPKFLHYASVIFVCLAGFMEKKMGEKLAALCHQQPKQIAPPSDWERAPPHAVAAAEKLIQQCSISSAPAARDDDDTSDDESNVNMTSIDQRSSAAATLKAPKTPRAKKTLTTSTQMASKRITSKAMRNFVPRDTKGIMDNLNGKEGFIRKYMTGKRCDFTARTVIAPDNDLDPRELGVPVLIAFHLTFAERVTDLNIASLQERVRRGPHHINGAKTLIIKRPPTTTNVLTESTRYVQLDVDEEMRCKYADALTVGDVVERFIQDGDVVLYNRQPSLHRMNLMQLEVKIGPWLTFRMNISLCGAYNADFDGDEMNLHFPQSYTAKAELLELCSFENNFNSFSRSKPVLSMIQDTLEAAYYLSLPDTFLTFEELTRMVMRMRHLHKCTHQACPPHRCVKDYNAHVKEALFDVRLLPPPAILKPQKLWTGKQILSLVLPRIFYDSSLSSGDVPMGGSANDTLDYDKNRVIIRDGVLLTGTLVKKHLSSTHLGILHTVGNDLGSPHWGGMRGINMVGDMQRLCNEYMRVCQITTSLRDMTTTEDVQVTVGSFISAVFERVQEVHRKVFLIFQTLLASCTTHAEREQVLLMQQRVEETELEDYAQSLLMKAMGQVSAILEESVDKSNSIYFMSAVVKSKGNIMNMAQILGAVGQQLLFNRRIAPRGTIPRLLPYFDARDSNPVARGFVANSYAGGLSPAEFVCHMVSSHEGLVDMSLRTAESGYLSRRMVKAFESFTILNDGTLRTNARYNNPQCRILQLGWGGCCLDTCHIERIPCQYFFNADDASLCKGCVLPSLQAETESARLLSIRATVRNARMEECVATGQVLDKRLVVPCDPERIVMLYQAASMVQVHEERVIEPAAVVERVHQWCEQLAREHGGHGMTLFMRAIVYYKLSSRRVCGVYKLTASQLEKVLEHLGHRYQDARIHTGQGVGVEAAEALSEPTMQMTLNTRHFVGQGISATTGLDALEELIKLAKKAASPIMHVYVKDNEVGTARYLETFAPETRLYHVMSDEFAAYTYSELRACCDDELSNMASIASTLMPWLGPPRTSKHVSIAPEHFPVVLSFPLHVQMLSRRHLSPAYLCDYLRAVWNDPNLLFLHTHCQMQQWYIYIVILDYPAIEARLSTLYKDTIQRSKTQKKQAHVQTMPNPSKAIISPGLMAFIKYNAQLLLCGIPNVSRASMRMEKSYLLCPTSGKLMEQSVPVVDMAGSNICYVRALDIVDSFRTTSTFMHDVYKSLGKHALSVQLFKEVKRQFLFSPDAVNDHYIAMLCDFMVSKSDLVRIVRNNLNDSDTTNTIDKITFEEVMRVLQRQSAMGSTEDVCNVSSKTVLGMLPEIGTGTVELYNDHNRRARYIADMDGYNDSFFDFDHDDGSHDHAMMDTDVPEAYSPTCPAYSGKEAVYSPTRPGFYGECAPTSPAYQASYGPQTVASPAYYPGSPSYGPVSSPTAYQDAYRPTSPPYQPTAPLYSGPPPPPLVSSTLSGPPPLVSTRSKLVANTFTYNPFECPVTHETYTYYQATHNTSTSQHSPVDNHLACKVDELLEQFAVHETDAIMDGEGIYRAGNLASHNRNTVYRPSSPCDNL